MSFLYFGLIEKSDYETGRRCGMHLRTARRSDCEITVFFSSTFFFLNGFHRNTQSCRPKEWANMKNSGMKRSIGEQKSGRIANFAPAVLQMSVAKLEISSPTNAQCKSLAPRNFLVLAGCNFFILLTS